MQSPIPSVYLPLRFPESESSFKSNMVVIRDRPMLRALWSDLLLILGNVLERRFEHYDPGAIEARAFMDRSNLLCPELDGLSS